MDDANRNVAKRQIARLLGGSANPMYVLSEETLVYANEAMGELFQRSPDELLGIDCKSPLSDDANPERSIASFLALPADWNRNSLKCLKESKSHSSVKRWPDHFPEMHFVRCLIPLELETNCTLCVLCPHDASMEVEDSERTTAILEMLRESRSRFASLDGLWYLQGKSASAGRAIEQFHLAIQNELSTLVLGVKGSGREWLSTALSAGRDSNVVHDSVVRIDCSLMDYGLLPSMLESVDVSLRRASQRTRVILENLEQLPNECEVMLVEFLQSRKGLRCIATCDLLALEERSKSVWHSILVLCSSIRIELPSLSERLQDMPTLVVAWLDWQIKQGGKRYEWTQGFVDALMAYSWPEDIEEFHRAMFHACEHCTNGRLSEVDLPVNIRTTVSHVEQTSNSEAVDLDAVLEEVEKTIILRAVAKFPQNKTSAAKLLNISRARLLRRLQQWGIQSEPSSIEGDDDLPVFNEVE